MSLSVGTDSYVTLSEANDLVASYFLSSDATRTAWNNASDSDREIALRKSCKSIDKIRDFVGKRKYKSQTLEFPRVKTVVAGVGYLPFVMQNTDNWIDSSVNGNDGLDDAKLAQTINAAYCLSMSDVRTAQMTNSVVGLTSKKMGPIAKTFATPDSNSYNKDLMIGIYTKDVYHVLSHWLNGTYYGI